MRLSVPGLLVVYRFFADFGDAERTARRSILPRRLGNIFIVPVDVNDASERALAGVPRRGVEELD